MKALYHEIQSFEDLLAYFREREVEQIYEEVYKSNLMSFNENLRDFSLDEVGINGNIKEHGGEYKIGCALGMSGESASILDFIDSFAERMEDYIKVYNMMEDDFSRKTYFYMLMFRLMPVHDKVYLDEVRIDSLQYFRKEIIPECKNGTYVDCGCFDGETVEQFIDVYGEDYKSIHFFEPMAEQFETCVERTKNFPNVFPHKQGVSKEDTILRFAAGGSASQIHEKGGIEVQVVTLDKEIVQKIDFLKMDVEGAEMDALQGAVMHLMNDKPISTICLYHLIHDIIDIPLYLEFLNPDQNFYMRYHGYQDSHQPWEIVLYAVPKERG